MVTIICIFVLYMQVSEFDIGDAPPPTSVTTTAVITKLATSAVTVSGFSTIWAAIVSVTYAMTVKCHTSCV